MSEDDFTSIEKDLIKSLKVEGYDITYNFLDQSVAQKFYEEHKDGGRIIWK